MFWLCRSAIIRYLSVRRGYAAADQLSNTKLRNRHLTFSQANTLPYSLLFFLHTTAVGRTNRFRYKRTCPAHSPLLGNIRRLSTSDTTRAFGVKVFTNQGARICVSISTTLSISLTNVRWEGVSITQFLSYILVYHILPCFYLIHIAAPYLLFPRNSVT
jgi:hypothetical protein